MRMKHNLTPPCAVRLQCAAVRSQCMLAVSRNNLIDLIRHDASLRTSLKVIELAWTIGTINRDSSDHVRYARQVGHPLATRSLGPHDERHNRVEPGPITSHMNRRPARQWTLLQGRIITGRHYFHHVRYWFSKRAAFSNLAQGEAFSNGNRGRHRKPLDTARRITGTSCGRLHMLGGRHLLPRCR